MTDPTRACSGEHARSCRGVPILPVPRGNVGIAALNLSAAAHDTSEGATGTQALDGGTLGRLTGQRVAQAAALLLRLSFRLSEAREQTDGGAIRSRVVSSALVCRSHQVQCRGVSYLTATQFDVVLRQKRRITSKASRCKTLNYLRSGPGTGGSTIARAGLPRLSVDLVGTLLDACRAQLSQRPPESPWGASSASVGV